LYASTDKIFVDRIFKDISISNVNVIPERVELSFGDRISKIFRGEEGSVILLPVISASSLQCDWAKEEVWQLIENKYIDVRPIFMIDTDLVTLEQLMPTYARDILDSDYYFTFDSNEDRYRAEVTRLLRVECHN